MAAEDLTGAAGVELRGSIRRGFILAKQGWTELEEVPLMGWFRPMADRKHAYRIHEFDLQYAGGISPGLEMKAGPAVLINLTWWRPNELFHVFEVSLDGKAWQECEGDLVSGFASDIPQDVMEEITQQIEIGRRQSERLDELARQVAELQIKAAAMLEAKPEPAKAKAAEPKPTEQKPKP